MEFVEKDGEKYVIIGKKNAEGKYEGKPLVFGVCHNQCCEKHENIENYPKDNPISGMGKCKVCGHVHDYS